MTESALRAYVDFLEGFDASALERLEQVVTHDVHFVDPFNDVIGIPAFRLCLEDMLHQVADLRIEVSHAGIVPAVAEAAEPVGVLRWRFSGQLARLRHRPWSVIGMSEVRLAPDGRVREHIDHWDAARGVYEVFPLIGTLLRAIRRRMAVDPRTPPDAARVLDTAAHEPARSPDGLQ